MNPPLLSCVILLKLISLQLRFLMCNGAPSSLYLTGGAGIQYVRSTKGLVQCLIHNDAQCTALLSLGVSVWRVQLRWVEPLAHTVPVCACHDLSSSHTLAHRLLEAGLSVAVVAARPGGYTAVHTVLTVNSASLAMMSVGWMLRSYIGFSNVARTLVFSWPA